MTDDRSAATESPDSLMRRRVEREPLPRHVAIIMDGNGRWAGQRGRQRAEGHRAGVAAVRDTVEAGAELGLEVLTLYAFSTENQKRPRYEVWTLMNLLKEYVRKETRTLVKNRIRLGVVGRWRELDPSVVSMLERALDATRDCTGMRLNIALNYSGRCEIVDACRRIVSDWAQGKGTDIDETTLGRYLYSASEPDPDLLIRTSGEMRVSNFLLWQLAYTELYFTDTLWPDFNRGEFDRALDWYASRQRRFGRTGEQVRDAQAAHGRSSTERVEA